ncbi:MAG: MFS transporter [Chloroflexi bacterium]|nr:MFS transporter [Chloroflexota bacterium]
MRRFLIIWFGQVVSLIGSGLTGFALGVWIYQETGRATPFVLVALFNSIPTTLLSPVAGALVDRWSRRKVMIAADIGAAFSTLTLFLLFTSGNLQLWHLYVLAFATSIFDIFQRLAYQTSVTMLVPKEQFGRANALIQTGESFGGILSPILAGALFGLVGIPGIFVIDLATFLFAVGALLLVVIPQPERLDTPGEKKPGLWADIRFGLDYLGPRPGLIALGVFIAVLNLLISASTVLSTPMILAFATPAILGPLQAASSVGLLLGGAIVSAWGGPKRKILGIASGPLISGIGLFLAGLRPNPWLIGAGMFIFLFPITMVNSSLRAILQTKVPPDLQGRVFSLIFMLARASVPVGNLIAGPLADRLFEPRMAAGGEWAAGWLGRLAGVGPGRGIALLFLIAGLGMWLATAVSVAYPRMRRVEQELPDVVA